MLTEWKLVTSTKARVDRFIEGKQNNLHLNNIFLGLSQVVEIEKLSLFNENELELLMAGLPTIDVMDWKQHTKYSGYTIASVQIMWFWEVVNEMREEDRALLLKFTCGTSSVPVVNTCFNVDYLIILRVDFNVYNIHLLFQNYLKQIDFLVLQLVLTQLNCHNMNH